MNQKEKGPDSRVTATAEIVSAYLLNHKTSLEELESLIERIYNKLASLDGGSHSAQASATSMPSGVDVASSITPDYIICLEDGKKLKMLKRYLKTNFDMTPEDYRKRWNLPTSYPMVAPNYAKKRSKLAKEIGLGKKAPGTERTMSKNRAAVAARGKSSEQTAPSGAKTIAKPKGTLPKGKLSIVKSTDVMKSTVRS